MLEIADYEYKRLLDLLESMVVILDKDGKISEINKKCCQVLGYQKDELLGQDWFATCLPKSDTSDTLEVVRQVFLKLMSGEMEKLEYYENPVLTKSGELRVIAWHNAMIRNEQGQIVGTISSGEDITDRKKIEEELHCSEERFKQLAESAGEWVWEVDINGLYTYSNQIIESMLGYQIEEIIGKKHFYDFFHPEEREELKAGAFEVFATKKPFKGFVNRNVNKDGQTRWLVTSGVPVLDDKGNLLGYRGTDTDITDNKQSKLDLEEKIHELEIFQEAAEGRELKIMEVKREVNKLLKELGREQKYKEID